MKRLLILGAAVGALLLVASGTATADVPEATSPVGAWVVYYEPGPDSVGDANTTMSMFDRGGTFAGTAWSDPRTNTVGSWEKVSGNVYRCVFYIMIPEAGGILKVTERFWMSGKDEMEGDQVTWWVPGSDPLGEAVGPIWWGTNLYKRIEPEPVAMP